MRKETYICKKRLFSGCLSSSIPTWLLHVKNDLHVWKESYMCEMRHYVYEERDLYMWKDTYICENRPYICEKRDLHMPKENNTCDKRPTYVKRDLHMPKENNTCDAGGLFSSVLDVTPSHMRDIVHSCMWHDSFTCVIYMCEKRPIYVRKETYICKYRRIHVTFSWLSLFICTPRDSFPWK